MTSLAKTLSNIVGQAFAANELPAELGEVRVSDRPDLAQFQCNGAMAAAKIAKKNPREIAGKIQEYLMGVGAPGDITKLEYASVSSSQNEIFSKVSVEGPGFINLNVTNEFLSDYVSNIENYGVTPVENAPTVVLDYGGANIAKSMHVGHLRAAIIGDTLRRIMKFAGYNTIGDVHLGDWGTHLGMLIGDYIRNGEENIVLDTDLSDGAAVEALMKDMGVRYPKASGEAKSDPALMKEAQDTTVKLQNKEDPYYLIWQKIREVSVASLKETYAKLGVTFDVWKGEADVHDLIEPMVENMREQGFAIEDDGAWIVPVAANDDSKKIPPLILYKRDGAVMYGTTDCATIVERMDLYQPSKIVYIVDQRQSLHFEQVFRAVNKVGITNGNVELTHAGFGTMNGKDGKPFKTRDGGVMRLEDLIAMAQEKAQDRLSEANLAADMDGDERNEVANKVAIAAIKFADLQNQRQADYVFDLDRLTSFEGKTGPYLLYQAVRIKSLIRKAEGQGVSINNSSLVVEEGTRDLALLLTEFPDAVDLTIRNYTPHVLCDYAYRLAQNFSSFYGNCHILSEEDNKLRNSRLMFCKKTEDYLETILSLLGIEVPKRM